MADTIDIVIAAEQYAASKIAILFQNTHRSLEPIRRLKLWSKT